MRTLYSKNEQVDLSSVREMGTMTKKHKRNLFAELAQGVDELNRYKAGKITLRTHTHEQKARPINAEFCSRNKGRKLFA